MRWLLLFWLLSVPVWAATITGPPQDITPGDFIIAALEIPLEGQTVELSFTPNGFDNPADTLTTLWEESEDGVTWHAWGGSTRHGGPMLGRQGQHLPDVTVITYSRFTGVVFIRMRGALTGAPITLQTKVKY